MIESVARPSTTRHGMGELVRTWQPAGTPWASVLIVHGLGEHSGRYDRTGSLLAETGLHVRSFDLIGFGASAGRRAHTEDWSLLLDQIEDHLAELGRMDLPRVLLGHSMGGLLALEYALAERPVPDLLVLSAPALAGGKPWQRAVAPVLAAIFPELAMPNQITGEQLSRDPTVGEAYFADPLVLTKTTIGMGAELFAAVDRVRSNLASLDIPTLVLHGGRDTVVPPTSTAALGELPVVDRRLQLSLRHELFNEPEGPELVTEVVEWVRSRLTSAS